MSDDSELAYLRLQTFFSKEKWEQRIIDLRRENAELREQIRLETLAREMACEETARLLERLEKSEKRADWFEQRCDTLQQAQKNMRDPERKMVCDILANGKTYETPNDHR